MSANNSFSTSRLPRFAARSEPHSEKQRPGEKRKGPETLVGKIARKFAGTWRRWGPEFGPWKPQAHLFALAVISGLAMRFAYPRWNVAALSAVGLAPLLWALSKARNGKQAFYIGWLFGTVFWYALVEWLNILVAYYPPIPAAVAAMALYLGVFKGLFGWVFWKIGRADRWQGWIAAAAAWVGIEYLQGLGDMGFPWGYLGHSLWRHPLLVQAAAWTGVYGLSLPLFWSNHLVADIAVALRGEAGASGRRRLAVRAAVLGGFVAGAVLYGTASFKRERAGDFYATPPVTVGIVQPNIPQKIKFRSYAADTPDEERARLQREILEKTIRLSEILQSGPTQGDDRCDLIIWPETAVTDDFFALRPAYRTFFDDLATTRLGAAVFFGATNLEIFRNGRLVATGEFDPTDYQLNPEAYSLKVYVSAWLAEPGRGLNPRIYNKIHLVPFAEGIPFVQHIKVLARLISAISGTQPFSHGKDHVVYEVRPPSSGGKGALIRFGPLICFESCFPDLSRALVRRGAEMLVVITNDAWYEQTAGPEQHELESVFRAVETRRWVARCANHGISCFVSPTGEIVDETQLAHDATLKRRVRGVKELTFYARWGDLFAWLALGATIGFLAAGKSRR